MWRDFDVPASEETIRKAANKALPKVLEKTRKNKTQLSMDLFNCRSALGRFLTGKEFSYTRLRKLVDGFDAALSVKQEGIAEPEADKAASG